MPQVATARVCVCVCYGVYGFLPEQSVCEIGCSWSSEAGRLLSPTGRTLAVYFWISMVICRKCNLMYRSLLQLSPGTGCKYSLLFFSMLVQFAPIPFWNMVVNMNALLGKAECFCDCSIIFIFNPSPPNSSTLVFFYHLCVWVYVCAEGRDSQTLHWLAVFMVHYNKSL